LINVEIYYHVPARSGTVKFAHTTARRGRWRPSIPRDQTSTQSASPAKCDSKRLAPGWHCDAPRVRPALRRSCPADRHGLAVPRSFVLDADAIFDIVTRLRGFKGGERRFGADWRARRRGHAAAMGSDPRSGSRRGL